MTNYQTFSKRITGATTIDDLNRLEMSLDRLWQAGQFTQTEFIRLDTKILNKKIKLEE